MERLMEILRQLEEISNLNDQQVEDIEKEITSER